MKRNKLVLIIVLVMAVIVTSFSSCMADHSVADEERERLAAESYGLDITTDNLEEMLYKKVKKEILTWDEEGIYAISFLVLDNESFIYQGKENVSMWAISYNTEKDCTGAGTYDEERWNYAYWRQNEYPIIDVDFPNQYTDVLFDWYEEQGIVEIGFEDESLAYDADMNYIGKGPEGHYELLSMASRIGRRLQEEGVIEAHFGKPIPIIVHGLEYAWYDIEATEYANPYGEGDIFLEAMKKLEFY